MFAYNLDYFSFGQHCIAVRSGGPGPLRPSMDFVFIHGRRSDSSYFDGMAAFLSLSHNAILVDLPGAGRSFSIGDERLSPLEMVDFIVRLAKRLGDSGVVLVGHDTGAALALLCAVTCPASVRGLLLGAPVLGFGEELHLGSAEGLFWKKRIARIQCPVWVVSSLASWDFLPPGTRILTDVESTGCPLFERPKWSATLAGALVGRVLSGKNPSDGLKTSHANLRLADSEALGISARCRNGA